MKKILFIIFPLILMFVFTANTYSQSKIAVGFHAGVNFASASRTPSTTIGTRTGLIFGGHVEFKVADIVFIEPQLQYIMKGGEVTDQGVTTISKINYIEIPLFVKLKFALTGSEFKPYVMAGPYFGLKASATWEQTSTQFGSQSGDDNNAEGTDIGIIFGAGGEYKIASNIAILFNAFYALGFTDVDKQNEVTAKLNGFRLVSGVKFTL